jgi:hypothetical protein
MANIITQTKLVDSTNRALIRYHIMSDGTSEANTKILDVSGLAFSLNTSGRIMTGNTNAKDVYRTSIVRIFGSYAAKNKGHVDLKWETTNGSNGTSSFVTFGEGFFDYNFTGMGHGDAVSTPPSNVNGDIIMDAGLANLDHITIYLDLKKDNRDFDAGQTARPSDFNIPGVV